MIDRRKENTPSIVLIQSLPASGWKHPGIFRRTGRISSCNTRLRHDPSRPGIYGQYMAMNYVQDDLDAERPPERSWRSHSVLADSHIRDTSNHMCFPDDFISWVSYCRSLKSETAALGLKYSSAVLTKSLHGEEPMTRVSLPRPR